MTAFHVRPVHLASTVLAAAVGLGACTSEESNQTTNTAASSARTDVANRLEAATGVVQGFRERIPDEVARETRCAIVVPSLVKGGLVVGVQSGKGFATCRTETGWSAVAPLTVSGGTLGAQIGASSTDVLTLVMTDRARASLLGGHFRVGVDASAAAGPVGTGDSTDFKLGSDVVSYTRSSGLFAGATMTGVTIDRDGDATKALYGSMPDVRALLDGQEHMPAVPAAEHFVTTVRTAFGVSGNVGSRVAAPPPAF